MEKFKAGDRIKFTDETRKNYAGAPAADERATVISYDVATGTVVFRYDGEYGSHVTNAKYVELATD